MTTFKPTSEEQVVEAVAWAISEEAPLEIVGRGSKRALGRAVQTANDLDLSGLSGITLYEPEELVLSAKAGTPLAEIEAALAAANQQLAFEPADLGPLLGGEVAAGSLGGLVACNLSGPRRIKAGAPRDHVLGLTAVSGRGEAFKSGGRVVKNVTGYDLSKLMTGSFGTLSVLTELTLKVLPRPETTDTLMLHGLDDARAGETMTNAIGSAHEVSAAAHVPAELVPALGIDVAAGAAVTCVRLEGPAPSVAARADALAAELAAIAPATRLGHDASLVLWQALRDVAPFVARPEMVWRISVPPSEGFDTVKRIRAALPEALAYFDWAGGLIWLGVPPADDAHHDLVRGAIGPAGGHATVIRAPQEVRAAIPVFQPQPPAMAALTKRIKDGFDPKQNLNPGRMYAGV